MTKNAKGTKTGMRFSRPLGSQLVMTRTDAKVEKFYLYQSLSTIGNLSMALPL
jgi:hypothetical protein